MVFFLKKKAPPAEAMPVVAGAVVPVMVTVSVPKDAAYHVPLALRAAAPRKGASLWSQLIWKFLCRCIGPDCPLTPGGAGLRAQTARVQLGRSVAKPVST